MKHERIRTTLWRFGLIGVLFAAAGCSTQPFVDSRREAGTTQTVGRSSASVVAICYNSRSATPAEVLALAETECAKTERVPRFDRQEQLACALTNPTRAIFRCVSPPA